MHQVYLSKDWNFVIKISRAFSINAEAIPTRTTDKREYVVFGPSSVKFHTPARYMEKGEKIRETHTHPYINTHNVVGFLV